MKIKLQEIPPEGLRLSLAEHPVTLQDNTLVLSGPIEGKLAVDKQGERDLHIRGRLSARLLLPCSRCLKMFGHLVETEFFVDYTPLIKTPIGQEHHLYGEELHLHFYQGDSLDTSEIIESQLHLEMPMAPLCQPDCKGLCPLCGEDLNVGIHICSKPSAGGGERTAPAGRGGQK